MTRQATAGLRLTARVVMMGRRSLSAPATSMMSSMHLTCARAATGPIMLMLMPGPTRLWPPRRCCRRCRRGRRLPRCLCLVPACEECPAERCGCWEASGRGSSLFGVGVWWRWAACLFDVHVRKLLLATWWCSQHNTGWRAHAVVVVVVVVVQVCLGGPGCTFTCVEGSGHAVNNLLGTHGASGRPVTGLCAVHIYTNNIIYIIYILFVRQQLAWHGFWLGGVMGFLWRLGVCHSPVCGAHTGPLHGASAGRNGGCAKPFLVSCVHTVPTGPARIYHVMAAFCGGG